MNPEKMTAHARESLRMAIGHGWTESSTACDYAVECLVGQKVDRQEAQRIVARVWDDHFKVWGPV